MGSIAARSSRRRMPPQSDAREAAVVAGRKHPGVPAASDGNPLDFVERNLVAGAVVELGRLGALVGRNLLGLLDGPARFEVGGDAGGPERMATNPGGEPRGEGPPLYHSQGVVPAEWPG